MNIFQYFAARFVNFYDSVCNRLARRQEKVAKKPRQKRKPGLFSNVGRAIKILSKVFFGAGLILSVLGWAVYMYVVREHIEQNVGLILFGILALFLGVFVSWVNCLLLYGFGSLVENSEIIAKNTARED